MAIRQSLEQDFVGQLIQWLNLHGIYAWRVNSGKVQTIHKSWVTLAPAGTPDVLGILPAVHARCCFNPGPCTHSPKCYVAIAGGRLLAVEAKSLKGKLRESQIAWRDNASRQGALVIEARALEDVEGVLRKEGYLR